MKILNAFVGFLLLYKFGYAAQFITSTKQTTVKISTHSQNIANQVHVHNFRRQEVSKGPREHPRYRNRISNRAKKYESQYLPYYSGGEWVYYRNASTNFPRPKILINETDPGYRDCNQICLKAYLNYGKICARRLNRHDWVYEYKEFDDMCQMELENCGTVGKRYDWYPLRQGPCATTDFPIQPTDGDQILKRLEDWEKRFLENPANDPANPFTITTTMPTLKPKKTKI